MVALGQQSPVWYVMDEAGCALAHSSIPNCRCVPFACCTTGKFYSILWPIEDIQSGDVLTRDFCPPLSVDEPVLQKKARQLVFEKALKLDSPVDLFCLSISQVSETVCLSICSSLYFLAGRQENNGGISNVTLTVKSFSMMLSDGPKRE